MNRPAIGYIRVSTARQAAEGVSLEAQTAKIQQWAALEGLDLISIETDAGISGKRSANRPGLQRAIDAACRLRCPLIVYSLSRFARSTRDTLELTERLKGAGASLASVTEKLDTSSANGEFFLTLLAALARLESQQTGERTRMALGHLKRQGKRVGRFAPFGYQWRDGTLEPVPTEQPAIQVIRQRRAAGDSLRTIAAALGAAGHRPRSGTRWYPKVIRDIAQRAV